MIFIIGFIIGLIAGWLVTKKKYHHYKIKHDAVRHTFKTRSTWPKKVK